MSDKEPQVSPIDLIRVLRLIDINRPLWYFMHYFFQSVDRGPEDNFFTAVGSTKYHHAYPGGLAYHTLHAAELGHKIAQTYNARGIKIDEELVVAGILLHDIGKMRGYKVEGKDEEGKWKITKTASEKLHHHIPTGYLMVAEAITDYNKSPFGKDWPISDELRDKLLHIVLSHHGRKSWSSPVLPQFIEAYVVHIVEFMDGVIDKFNGGEIPDNLYDH